MKTWKNSPQKLLIIHNQQFFSLPAWLAKRPILGRSRNFIGSPCLLSTISLHAHIDGCRSKFDNLASTTLRTFSHQTKEVHILLWLSVFVLKKMLELKQFCMSDSNNFYYCCPKVGDHVPKHHPWLNSFCQIFLFCSTIANESFTPYTVFC